MSRRSLLALGLATLLAGCGSFKLPQPTAWAGTGQPVLNYTTITALLLADGAKLQGTYQMTGLVPSSGLLDLTLNGDTVHGSVDGLGGCSYDVTGTASDVQLNLSLEPRACLLGVSGTWTLNKCTTGTLDTLCGNIRETAALEDVTPH